MNIHHLYPKNAIDGKGTNNKINKILLSEKTHNNWHKVFRNLEFHNQVIQVLEMNTQIVQRKVLQDLFSIVTQNPEFIYENGVYIRKY